MEPKAIIESVLSKVGVLRVISVDDKYKPYPEVADILGQLLLLQQDTLESLLGPFPGVYSRDVEVFSNRFRMFWEAGSGEVKQEFVASLQLSELPDNPKLTVDLAAMRSLPDLFQSYEFRTMGLSDWRASAKDIFAESTARRTMVLFDEDFSDQQGSPTEGLVLIKETLGQTNEDQLICCLVSHNYHIDTLPDAWKRLCKDNDFPAHRVIVIPKELLIDSPVDFAGLVKLAAVSKYYEILRETVRQIFQECLETANKKIIELNIYDLDQIVFVSSDCEGVWEPDTLLRLLGIFHHTETRARALKNETLRSASAEVRRISGIATPVSFGSSSNLWKIHHLENYEDATLLNELHRPTDLGDIYQREGGRRYILIAPQCDLMVRTMGGFRGSDSDFIKEGLLAELVDREPKRGLGWKLDFFDEGRATFADFKKTLSVRLICLDLCVFNADGSAEFSLGGTPSALLIPAWEKRFGVVKKELQRVINTYKRVDPRDSQKAELNRLLTKANNEATLFGAIDAGAGDIKMNFKRVGRLLPPRSTSLVKAYSVFLNRDAFEHSFLASRPVAKQIT